MRTRVRIVIASLFAAVALLLVLLIRVEAPAAPVFDEAPRAVHAAPASSSESTFPDDREPVAAEPERIAVEPPKSIAAEPDAKEPESKDRIVELFESLDLQPGYWNAFHSVRSFSELDLSKMRKLVEENRLTSGELLDAQRRLGPRFPLSPAIVVACSFCEDVKPLDFGRLQRLAELDHDARTLHEGNLVPASSYAATLALWMQGAQDELAPVARESLSRYLDLSPLENRESRSAFLRDSASLALDTLDVANSAELRRHLGTALAGDATERVTEAAWRLHGRSADKSARLEIIQQARKGLGPAMFALESIRGDPYAAVLEDLARSAPNSEPGNALAASACVALISNSTPKSWRAFERVWRDMHPRPFTWEALERADRPQNLGNLLVSANRRARTPHEQSLHGLVEACIDSTRARLDRCTVPRSAVRETCRNVRSILSDIADQPGSLDVALRVLVAHGDDQDKRLAWGMSRYLSDAALKDIQAALGEKR